MIFMLQQSIEAARPRFVRFSRLLCANEHPARRQAVGAPRDCPAGEPGFEPGPNSSKGCRATVTPLPSKSVGGPLAVGGPLEAATDPPARSNQATASPY